MYLSTAEAVQLLASERSVNLQAQSIIKWCKSGLIKGAYKVQAGKRGDWRIPADELRTVELPKRGWRPGKVRSKVRGHRTLPIYTERQRARFWSRVEQFAPEQCWEWRGNFTSTGYGRFPTQEGSYFAHRVAYYLATGIDPVGLDILHSCDNPKCCNPNHLRPGTDLENARDKHARNRQHYQRGAEHHNVKLTVEQVREIRKLCADRVHPQSQIALMFGISQTTVNDIHRSKSWRSLE